jgi:hypothetical protein
LLPVVPLFVVHLLMHQLCSLEQQSRLEHDLFAVAPVEVPRGDLKLVGGQVIPTYNGLPLVVPDMTVELPAAPGRWDSVMGPNPN